MDLQHNTGQIFKQHVEIAGSDSKSVDAFKIVMPAKKLGCKLMEHIGFGEG